MKKNNLLAKDVDLKKLASITNNYTGAEIEAVCRSASSFALFKQEELDLHERFHECAF
jgi:vesicle-fusing ATPase